MASDLLVPFTGLLDTVAEHLTSIGTLPVLIGLALFASTMGDDVKDKYMLHYWVRSVSSPRCRQPVLASQPVHLPH